MPPGPPTTLHPALHRTSRGGGGGGGAERQLSTDGDLLFKCVRRRSFCAAKTYLTRQINCLPRPPPAELGYKSSPSGSEAACSQVERQFKIQPQNQRNLDLNSCQEQTPDRSEAAP